MHILTGHRRNGKTSTLLRTCAILNRECGLGSYVIVVATDARARTLMGQARELGVYDDIPVPINPRRALSCGDMVKGFLIDDLDEFLKGLYRRPVVAVSIGDATVFETMVDFKDPPEPEEG